MRLNQRLLRFCLISVLLISIKVYHTGEPTIVQVFGHPREVFEGTSFKRDVTSSLLPANEA